MSTETWTVPEWLDSMKSKIEADATVSAMEPDVEVYTAEPSAQVMTSDIIVLGYEGNDNDEEGVPLGQGSRDETQLIKCYVQVVRPGAGETIAKEARDDAASIIRAVDGILRSSPPSVGSQTYATKLAARDFAQFPSEVGSSSTPVRVCVIQFDIQYRARTST